MPICPPTCQLSLDIYPMFFPGQLSRVLRMPVHKVAAAPAVFMVVVAVLPFYLPGFISLCTTDIVAIATRSVAVVAHMT